MVTCSSVSSRKMNSQSVGIFLLITVSHALGAYSPPYRESLVSVNTKKWLHTVSDKFVSLTVDPHELLKSENFGKAAINMARSLSPAYFRVGGPGSDHFSFQPKNDDYDFLSNSTVTISEWVHLNELIEDSGLSLIICLNAITRLDGVWDSRNTLQLVSFSDRRGYNMDFELGYESQWTVVEGSSFPGAEMGRDVVRLRKILDAYPRYSQSVIIGPDLTRLSRPEDVSFARNYLIEAGNSLSALTLHPRFSNVLKPEDDASIEMLQMIAQLENNIWGKDVLSRLSAKAPPRKSIWIAESKQKDGVPQFADSIHWLRRLGAAARLGVQVMMTQPHSLSFTSPTADFWMLALHKALVGRQVLETKLVSGNKTMIEAYSHCTQTVHNPEFTILDDTLVRYEKGAVTVFGTNMADEKMRLTLRGNVKDEEIHKYILTEGRDPSTGERIVLFNNQKLNLSSEDELPILTPKIRKPSRSMALTLPPRSIFFIVMPDIKSRTCMLPLNAFFEETKSKVDIAEEVVENSGDADTSPSEEVNESNEIFVTYRNSPLFIDRSLNQLLTNKDKLNGKTKTGDLTKKSRDPPSEGHEPIVKYITFSDNNWLGDFQKTMQEQDAPKEEEDNFLLSTNNSPTSYTSYSPGLEPETPQSRRDKYKIFTDAVFGRRNVSSDKSQSDKSQNQVSDSLDTGKLKTGRVNLVKRHVDLHHIEKKTSKDDNKVGEMHNGIEKDVLKHRISENLAKNVLLEERLQHQTSLKEKARAIIEKSHKPLHKTIEEREKEKESEDSEEDDNNFTPPNLENETRDSDPPVKIENKFVGDRQKEGRKKDLTDKNVHSAGPLKKNHHHLFVDSKNDPTKTHDIKTDTTLKEKNIFDAIAEEKNKIEIAENKTEKEDILPASKRKPRELSASDEFFLKLLLDLDLFERMGKDAVANSELRKREVNEEVDKYDEELNLIPSYDFKESIVPSVYDESKDDILRILREERGNKISIGSRRRRDVEGYKESKLETMIREAKEKMAMKNNKDDSDQSGQKVSKSKSKPKLGKSISKGGQSSGEETLSDGSVDPIVSPIKSKSSYNQELQEKTLGEIGKLSREKIIQAVKEKTENLMQNFQSKKNEDKSAEKSYRLGSKRGKNYQPADEQATDDKKEENSSTPLGAGKKAFKIKPAQTNKKPIKVVSPPKSKLKPLKGKKLKAPNPLSEVTTDDKEEQINSESKSKISREPKVKLDKKSSYQTVNEAPLAIAVEKSKEIGTHQVENVADIDAKGGIPQVSSTHNASPNVPDEPKTSPQEEQQSETLDDKVGPKKKDGRKKYKRDLNSIPSFYTFPIRDKSFVDQNDFNKLSKIDSRKYKNILSNENVVFENGEGDDLQVERPQRTEHGQIYRMGQGGKLLDSRSPSEEVVTVNRRLNSLEKPDFKSPELLKNHLVEALRNIDGVGKSELPSEIFPQSKSIHTPEIEIMTPGKYSKPDPKVVELFVVDDNNGRKNNFFNSIFPGVFFTKVSQQPQLGSSDKTKRSQYRTEDFLQNLNEESFSDDYSSSIDVVSDDFASAESPKKNLEKSVQHLVQMIFENVEKKLEERLGTKYYDDPDDEIDSSSDSSTQSEDNFTPEVLENPIEVYENSEPKITAYSAPDSIVGSRENNIETAITDKTTSEILTISATTEPSSTSLKPITDSFKTTTTENIPIDTTSSVPTTLATETLVSSTFPTTPMPTSERNPTNVGPAELDMPRISRRSLKSLDDNEISHRSEDETSNSNENDLEFLTNQVKKKNLMHSQEEKIKMKKTDDLLFHSVLKKHYNRMISSKPNTPISSSPIPEIPKVSSNNNTQNDANLTRQNVIQKIELSENNDGHSSLREFLKLPEGDIIYPQFIASIINQITSIISQIQSSYFMKQFAGMF